MNKEFLHMQKLAGIITEGEYKAKLRENEDTNFIKSEMERLISKVSNNSEIPEEEKMERIDNIKFVIYDFLDPETRGGKRPPIGFKFDDRWWSSVKSLDPIVYQDALSELLSAAKGSDPSSITKGEVNEEINSNMEKSELLNKIKNLGDFGFTGDKIEFNGLLITASTQEDEGGPYYFVYGEDDESEDGIFNSTKPEEIADFVFNF